MSALGLGISMAAENVQEGRYGPVEKYTFAPTRATLTRLPQRGAPAAAREWP